MSDRTVTVLRLCALPARDPERARMHNELLAQAVSADKVDAKFRDFARRGFITTIEWHLSQLTPAGQRALERATA